MDVSMDLKYILKVWEHFKIEKFKAYIILEEQEKKRKIAENRTSTPALDSTENLELFFKTSSTVFPHIKPSLE